MFKGLSEVYFRCFGCRHLLLIFFRGQLQTEALDVSSRGCVLVYALCILAARIVDMVGSDLLVINLDCKSCVERAKYIFKYFSRL
jgi:hypothetical protein